MRFLDVGDAGAQHAQRLVQQALAQLRGLLRLDGLQEMPDMRTRLGRDYVVQP